MLSSLTWPTVISAHSSYAGFSHIALLTAKRGFSFLTSLTEETVITLNNLGTMIQLLLIVSFTEDTLQTLLANCQLYLINQKINERNIHSHVINVVERLLANALFRNIVPLAKHTIIYLFEASNDRSQNTHLVSPFGLHSLVNRFDQ